jgi:hypothetical protein
VDARHKAGHDVREAVPFVQDIHDLSTIAYRALTAIIRIDQIAE